jgi:palmitoyltransferase
MERNVAANIWTARTIPVLLAGVIGYATYVTVIPLCGKIAPPWLV